MTRPTHYESAALPTELSRHADLGGHKETETDIPATTAPRRKSGEANGATRKYHADLEPQLLGHSAVVDSRRFARFMAKVSPEPNTGCWLWLGNISSQGYGKVWDQRTRFAHRVAFEMVRGFLPPLLDHICRNRSCVNPQHLRPLSAQENVLIGIGPTAVNARKTVCSRGHPFDALNTLVRADGSGRACKTCKNLTNRKPENSAKHVAAKRRRRHARRAA